MNPEKFAQFFYDQGVSATVDNVSRKSKNINMDIRNAAQQTVTKDGMRIRAVGDTNSGRGLKIRSIKKV
jgi:sulfur relay (sulfurtransferase) complex TusBCD TusD component (DsrE family)